MASIFAKPDHWRQRAKEARAIADDFSDPNTKRLMLDIAAAYDAAANHAGELEILTRELLLPPEH